MENQKKENLMTPQTVFEDDADYEEEGEMESEYEESFWSILNAEITEIRSPSVNIQTLTK